MTNDTGLQQAFGHINSGLSLPGFFNEKVLFPSLEELKLSSMCQLKRIWHSQLHGQSFYKLASLTVELCENLSHVFSSNSMDMLQSLNKIKAVGCPSLEALFEPINLRAEKRQKPLVLPALRELTLLNLSRLRDILESDCKVTLAFPSLMEVNVKGCHSLPYLFSSAMAEILDKLAVLDVSCCNNLRGIIAMEEGKWKTLETLKFHQLSTLKLGDLENLISFCSVSCASDGLQPLFDEKHHYVFRNPIELDLACYHDENVTFPSNFLLHGFPNLEVLSLSCSSFEEIFPEDACGHGGATFYGESTDMETSLKTLKNLWRLELNKLCKLQRIWKDGSLMAEILKQIETLLISECSSLSIVLPSPTTFQRLVGLEVGDCASLVHMGTCSAMTSLVHLIWLTLRNCDTMEDVVTNDGNGVGEISFPKLQLLTLDGLPSLESFSPTNCTFMFPSLWHIIVKQCPKMNIFCNGALSTPILHKVHLSDEDYEGRWEGDLNTTIQFLST
ncbi:uncharacterized protein LOC120290640 [Eucalyptus grandis]|uniref:uncharacterized protein LOC120290640 n=1 Tax=Eucalyptus grandis TaxID=71139 RepID=UPI00192EF32F|nr:uncharacterized protein LOC120290640 [Eucalyptus grandis]